MEVSSRRRFLARSVGGAGLLGLAARRGVARTDGNASPMTLIQKGVAFLRTRQSKDGSWSPILKEPGITAVAAMALLRSGLMTPEDPVVTRAFAYLEQFFGPKGGLSEAVHSNYATAVALMAFKEANRKGRYDRVIQGGIEFLKGKQWDESEGKHPQDVFYGGAGYGTTNSRPDLSNTTYFVDALHDTGLPADDPSLKKAIVFISRCQNLKGEFNDQPWADKINDGGFIYTAANGGTSIAGKTDDGGLRSYASMTYSGLRSMIYAGLTRDDPRVKAARAYIAHHYTLDENPGLGQWGLYYYYQTFAKTMAVLGEPTFADSEGRSHDWKADLVAALAKRQAANGGWVNPTPGFLEGDPSLATAFALLALSYARAKA